MTRTLRASPISIIAGTVFATLIISALIRNFNSSQTARIDGVKNWQEIDAKYIGPTKGDAPPARLDSYKYKTNEYQVPRGIGHCWAIVVRPAASILLALTARTTASGVRL